MIAATNLCIYGCNDLELPLAGFTVAQVMYALADPMNFNPAGVEVHVDGFLVINWKKFVLRQSSTVLFWKVGGRKGSGDQQAGDHDSGLPLGTPSWITLDLVAETIRVWSPYYDHQLDVDDAIELLTQAEGLLDVLYTNTPN